VFFVFLALLVILVFFVHFGLFLGVFLKVLINALGSNFQGWLLIFDDFLITACLTRFLTLYTNFLDLIASCSLFLFISFKGFTTKYISFSWAAMKMTGQN